MSSLLSPSLALRLILVLLLLGVCLVLSEAQDIPVLKTCLFGETCVLECCLNEQFSEIMWEFDRMPVQWFPRSQEYHQHYRLKNRTSLSDDEVLKGNCALTIRDVQPQDQGLHTCTITGISGREESLKYNISVSAPVEKVSIVRSGDWLICSSEQVHPEPQCRWSGEFSNSNVTVHRDDQGLYSINCTTRLIHGVSEYRCTVNTTHSSKSATYTELHFSISLISMMIAVLIAAPLTALVLGTYKRGQVPPKTQKSESQSSSPDSSSSAKPPADRFHVVWIICGLLGLNSVLSWNSFVMALLYFKHHENISGQNWISCLIVLISQLAQLLSVSFSSYFVPRFTLRKHITGCLIGITLQFVTVLVSMKMLTEETFFGISMCAVWLASLFGTMVQCHLSVEVDLLPQSHRHTFTNGQASAGIVASVVMIILVAITGDVELSVWYFFVFGLVVSLVALLCYLLLPRLEFAKHFFNRQHQMREESSFELITKNDDKNNNGQEDAQSSARVAPQSGDCEDAQSFHPPRWVKKFCKQAFCVMLVQLVSFSVHPAITSDIHTVSSGKWSHFFILVCCFFIFNFFTFIGQKMVLVFQAHKHFLILFLILVILHTGFIPVFMFCNVQPRTFLYANTQLFNDVGFSVVMALFSFSHGFLTDLTIFYAPNQEEDDGDGRPQVIGRALGSVGGALLSFALRAGI